MRAAGDVGEQRAIRVQPIDDLRHRVDEVLVRGAAVRLVVRAGLVVGEASVGVEKGLHRELMCGCQVSAAA